MNGHDTDSRDSDSLKNSSRTGANSKGLRTFARLKKRSEFLAVAKGARIHDSVFTVQAIRRPGDEIPPLAPAARFGLTVTKKTGNSVERNRIRRRLREVLRLSSSIQNNSLSDRAAHDYVIVARREALSRDFSDLTRELSRAIERIDKRLASRSEAPRGPRRDGASRTDAPQGPA
ncbi:MAG: ribonuclease protein component [Hyphomicrobiales bacterium]|nr:ribonuclease protein component [Hyphomicrobiales bacterium]